MYATTRRCRPGVRYTSYTRAVLHTYAGSGEYLGQVRVWVLTPHI